MLLSDQEDSNHSRGTPAQARWESDSPASSRNCDGWIQPGGASVPEVRDLLGNASPQRNERRGRVPKVPTQLWNHDREGEDACQTDRVPSSKRRCGRRQPNPPVGVQEMWQHAPAPLSCDEKPSAVSHVRPARCRTETPPLSAHARQKNPETSRQPEATSWASFRAGPHRVVIFRRGMGVSRDSHG